MNRSIIQDLDDITDSRELIEARPNNFTILLAYILIALLVIALILSYFGKIDIVTKTNGVIKSLNKTTSVLNEIDGKITSVNFKEGQVVQEGDTLYTIDCSDTLLNKETYEKQLIDLEKDTENINKLRNSILDDTNYFDKNNTDEVSYYNKYLQYVTSNQKLQLVEKQTGLEINSSNDEKSESLKNYNKQINDNNELINNLNILLNSIKNSKSGFSDSDSVYSSEYTDYLLTIEGLENTIEQKQLDLESAENDYKESMNDYENEMYNAKISYDNSIYRLQQYKSSYISEIESKIIDAKNSLKDLNNDNDTMDLKLEQNKDKIENIEKLIDSINSGENLFDESEKTYYKKYVEYTNGLERCNDEDKEQYTNAYLLKLNESIDETQELLDQLKSGDSDIAKEKIKKEINNLNTLRDSINENENEFSDEESEYYNKFSQYKSSLSELENNIEIQKEKINNLTNKKNTIVDSYKNKIESLKKLIESAKRDVSKYKNNSALDVKKKLDDASKSIDTLESDLDKCKFTPELDSINQELATNEITKYKIDTLVELDNNTKNNETKITELKSNIETLQLSIDKSTVKAMIDGIISVKQDIAEGELLASGTEVLEIIPKNDSQYKVQLYVSNKDITGIEVGQKIKYHFDALPYKEYGELTGEITDIAVDSSIDTRSGISYYLVESEIKNEPLFSYKGEQGELKMGMTCEAQVITKQKRILYYLLEKLNFKI